MSMLSSQADELRETANKVDKLEAWERVSVPWMQGRLAPMLREAADTITSLSDKLQEAERHNRINLEVMGEMYHPEIVELMQECHATQANYEHCKYSTNRGWCDTSRYAGLFGTPERAAKYFAMQCFGSDGSLCYYCPFDDCDENLSNMGTHSSVHDKMLEWLRGEA